MEAAGQYLGELQNQRLMTMQGYMTQMNAVIAADEQYLNIYSQSIENVYNHFMMEMGLEEHDMNMASEWYAQNVVPYYDQLNALIQLMNAQTAQTAANYEEPGFFNKIFG